MVKEMTKKSKRSKKVAEAFEKLKYYSLEEGIAILKGFKNEKFDETIEIQCVLDVDPKNSQQMVRGSVVLPHGTGKQVRVLAICNGEARLAAEKAGADICGGEDIINRIQGGFLDFDAVVATPEMMKDVAKIGRVLGPRGLMPNPKTGSVTQDIARAVRDAKAGKIEFRVDKLGNIYKGIGKVSFDDKQLAENAITFIHAVVAAKPQGLKGTYFKAATLSSTMGPGVKLELATLLRE